MTPSIESAAPANFDGIFVFGVIASMVVHVAIVRGVDDDPAHVRRPTPDTLEWIALPPPQPKPEVHAEESRETEFQTAPTARRESAPEHSTREPTPVTTEPSRPLDLTGVTLSSGTDGWAPTGNGEVGDPIRARHGGPREGARDQPHRAGPALVAIADLSRPPRPPELDRRLLERYPASARRRGAGGTALMRARILPTGRIDRLRVLDATSALFAQACREVLNDSRWSAPLDAAGNPVATEIQYRCEFRVR